MRLQGKIAIVIGAGQSPGEGIGNGRVTVLRFAREGARILAVDRDLTAAAETTPLVTGEGLECAPFEADVTREARLAAAMEEAMRRWGRIDILHNNVGVSVAGVLIAWAALPRGDSRPEKKPQPLLDLRPVFANRDVLALIVGYAAAIWGCVGLRQWVVVFLTFVPASRPPIQRRPGSFWWLER